MSFSPEASEVDPSVMETLVYFQSVFAHPPNMPQTPRQRELMHDKVDRAAVYLAVGNRESNQTALDLLYDVEMFRMARVLHERQQSVVVAERLRRLRVEYADCVAYATPVLRLVAQHGESEVASFEVSTDLDYGNSPLTTIIDASARVLLSTLVDDTEHQLPLPDATLKDTEPFVQTLYGFWFGTAYYYLSRAEDFSAPTLVEMPQLPNAA